MAKLSKVQFGNILFLALLSCVYGCDQGKIQSILNLKKDDVEKLKLDGPGKVKAATCVKFTVSSVDVVDKPTPTKIPIEFIIKNAKGMPIVTMTDPECNPASKATLSLNVDQSSVEGSFFADTLGPVRLEAKREAKPLASHSEMTVVPGYAAKLQFIQEPPTEGAINSAFAAKLKVTDFFSNPVEDFNKTIVVSFQDGLQNNRMTLLRSKLKEVLKDGTIPEKMRSTLMKFPIPDPKIKEIINSGKFPVMLLPMIDTIPITPEAAGLLESLVAQGTESIPGTKITESSAVKGEVTFAELRIPPGTYPSNAIQLIFSSDGIPSLYHVLKLPNVPQSQGKEVYIDGRKSEARFIDSTTVQFKSVVMKIVPVAKGKVRVGPQVFTILEDTPSKLSLKTSR